MHKIPHLIKIFCSKSHAKWTPFLKLVNYISSSTTTGLLDVEPTNVGTMSEVYRKIGETMGLKPGYNRYQEPRDHLLKYTPKPEDLPPRTMPDSYVKAVLPLSTCQRLHLRFVAPGGTVRLGRLMEEMDLFAVWVCHEHVHVPKLPPNVHMPYTFVTILVDKMTFNKLLPAYNQDLQFSGFVSWVGKTSLEVSVWLEQKHQNALRLITQAVFLMGARNATNTKGAPVNSLQCCNDNEKSIFNLGEQRHKKRKHIHETSIFKIKPTEKEHSVMYDVFQSTRDKTSLRLNNRMLPPDCHWMNDSYVVKTFLSFPENSNGSNTVFGGFLMRQAFETSWMCAFLHCGHRPICEHSCDISFDKPIAISSFIKMTAYIVYTKDNLMQIMTVAEVLDPITRSASTTNTFYYTFSSKDKVGPVLPRTYHESIWYIHGKRKFEDVMET